jgi:N-ethylmaleimide reductase
LGHSSVRHGELPVAPSARRIEGQQHYTPTGLQDYEVPQALSTDEVRAVVQD